MQYGLAALCLTTAGVDQYAKKPEIKFLRKYKFKTVHWKKQMATAGASRGYGSTEVLATARVGQGIREQEGDREIWKAEREDMLEQRWVKACLLKSFQFSGCW